MVNNFTCQQILKKPKNKSLTNFQKKSSVASMDYNMKRKMLIGGYQDGVVVIWKVKYDQGIFHGAKLHNTLISEGGVAQAQLLSNYLNNSNGYSNPNLFDVMVVLDRNGKIKLYNQETNQKLKDCMTLSTVKSICLVEQNGKILLLSTDSKCNLNQYGGFENLHLGDIVHQTFSYASRNQQSAESENFLNMDFQKLNNEPNQRSLVPVKSSNGRIKILMISNKRNGLVIQDLRSVH